MGKPTCWEHRELWQWLSDPGFLAAGSAGKGQLLAGKGLTLQHTVSSTGNSAVDALYPWDTKSPVGGKRDWEALHRGLRSRLLLGIASYVMCCSGDGMGGPKPWLHHPFLMAVGARCLCLPCLL